MTCIGVYRWADQVFLHPNYVIQTVQPACVRGRIDVERKERVRVGRRLGDPGNSARELTRQNRPLEPRHWFECGGQAGNTNRKLYSRRVVSGSSVNVIANPVRVAPIPKVIAHVPTNIVITTSGVGL
jgi:hypothetical protein